MSGLSCSTSDTVDLDTPASAARSVMVTGAFEVDLRLDGIAVRPRQEMHLQTIA